MRSTITILSLAATAVQAYAGGYLVWIDDSFRGMALSSDGSTVVGEARINGPQGAGYAWNRLSGMTTFRDIPGGRGIYGAMAVSRDGSVVVGSALRGGGGSEAYRWTKKVGTEVLTPLGEGSSYADDVSDDGSIIVGSSAGNAYRWTRKTGMVMLPGFAYSANGISGDGTTIVGAGRFDGGLYACRWVKDGAPEILGRLPGTRGSEAHDVSQDGSVVVGMMRNMQLKFDAFYWTREDGMQRIPGLNEAFCVSGDGMFIGGASRGVAYVWNKSFGLQKLSDVLKQAGVPFSGKLTYVSGIEHIEGKLYVTGFGIPPTGGIAAFYAVIAPD